MYCTVQDIEGYYQAKTFDCDSYVDTQEMDSHIKTQSVLINMVIKKKYTLPITDTDDQIFLKMLNEYLVIGIIDDIIREKDPTGTLERSRDYGKEGKSYLKMLAKGELVLDSSEKASVIKFNNVDSNGNDVEKEYKISDIEPIIRAYDRERHTVTRVT